MVDERISDVLRVEVEGVERITNKRTKERTDKESTLSSVIVLES